MKSFDWRQFREQWLRSRDQVPPPPGYSGPLPDLPELPDFPPMPEPTYMCPICVAIEMEHVIPVVTLLPDGGVKLVQDETRVSSVDMRNMYYPFPDADSVALCAHHLRSVDLLSQYNVMIDATGQPFYDHLGDWRLELDRKWAPFAAYHRAEQIRGWKRHGRRLLRHKRAMNWMDRFDTPDADRIRSDEEGE